MTLLSNTTITSYVNLGLFDTAENVTVTNGGNILVFGGELEDSTILNGGIFLLKPGGIVSNTVLGTSGSGIISGGNAYGLVLAGGSLLETGGTAAGTTIGLGGDFTAHGGTLSNTTLTNAGYLDANGGSTTITNSSFFVDGGPTLINTTVTNSALLQAGYFEPVTFTSSETVIGGGATAISTTIADGGILNAIATSAIDTTINSGGTETLTESVDSGAIINAGGKQILTYDATAYGAIVQSGGMQILQGGAAAGTTIANGGTLLLSGQSSYFGLGAPGDVTSTTILSGGMLIISSGGIAYDTDVQAGGTLIVAAGAANYYTSGAGTVIGQENTEILNNVTLASGASQTLNFGDVANNTVIDNGAQEYVNGGTINGTTIDGGVLSWYGGVSNDYGFGENHSEAAGGITFAGSGGAMNISGSLVYEDLGPGIFEALPQTPIYGFGPGDLIAFGVVGPSFDDGENIGPFSELVTVSNGSDGVSGLTYVGDNGDTFMVTGDIEAAAITQDEITFVACYAAGTRIRTPRGNIAIENLQPGDLVHTMHRGAQPVRWIGQRRYAGRFLNHLALPIRLRRHAIAQNIPSRDLLVSPDHAVCEGGALIPAWRLINGVSITQEAVEDVHYFHLELDRHDVIFAENTPAESFLDTGCRGRFQSGMGIPAGRGAFCLPRVEHGCHLQSIRRRLAARAGLAEPAGPGGRLFGYIDIAGPARVAGWARNEVPADEPVELEVWLDGRVLARILADRYRPDLRAAGFGTGCHAFEFSLPPGLAGTCSIRRASDGAALPLTDAARAA